MNTSFFEEMKAALLHEQAKLEEELAGITTITTPHAPGQVFTVQTDSSGSDDENAAKIAEYGDNLSLQEELRDALKDVVSALSAVTNGTYGVCKYCNQKISEDRLRARPTSTSCLACKKTLTQEL
jgi:DnaK suppressor protein